MSVVGYDVNIYLAKSEKFLFVFQLLIVTYAIHFQALEHLNSKEGRCVNKVMSLLCIRLKGILMSSILYNNVTYEFMTR